MENCLITKLNAVVENSNLKKIGEIVLDINISESAAIENRTLLLSAELPFYVRITGNGYFTDSTGTQNLGTELSLSATEVTIYLSTGNYKLFIGNKQTLFKIYLVRRGEDIRINLSEFDYAFSFISLQNICCTGKMTFNRLPGGFFPNPSMSNLTPINIDYLQNFEPDDLSQILYFTKYTGSISSLYKYNNMSVQCGIENLTGSFESLAEARANRHISGIYSIVYADKCTINGIPQGNVPRRFVFTEEGTAKIYGDIFSDNPTLLAEFNGSTWTYY